jgi:hypothetical protein
MEWSHERGFDEYDAMGCFEINKIKHSGENHNNQKSKRVIAG